MGELGITDSDKKKIDCTRSTLQCAHLERVAAYRSYFNSMSKWCHNSFGAPWLDHSTMTWPSCPRRNESIRLRDAYSLTRVVTESLDSIGGFIRSVLSFPNPVHWEQITTVFNEVSLITKPDFCSENSLYRQFAGNTRYNEIALFQVYWDSHCVTLRVGHFVFSEVSLTTNRFSFPRVALVDNKCLWESPRLSSYKTLYIL